MIALSADEIGREFAIARETLRGSGLHAPGRTLCEIYRLAAHHCCTFWGQICDAPDGLTLLYARPEMDKLGMHIRSATFAEAAAHAAHNGTSVRMVCGIRERIPVEKDRLNQLLIELGNIRVLPAQGITLDDELCCICADGQEWLWSGSSLNQPHASALDDAKEWISMLVASIESNLP